MAFGYEDELRAEISRLRNAVRSLLDDVNARHPEKPPRDWSCPYMAELDRLVPLYTAVPESWQLVADNERFPDEGVEVLVFADGRRCNAERWRGEWWHACQGFEKRGGRMLKRVTHWMPLPEPPKTV